MAVNTNARIRPSMAPLPNRRAKASAADHVCVGPVGEQPPDLGAPALEREALVYIALVGDLVRVDRGRVREEKHPRDLLRGAALRVEAGDSGAHVLANFCITCELGDTRGRARARDLLAARDIEPGEEPGEFAALARDDRVLQRGRGGGEHGDAQRSHVYPGAARQLEIFGEAAVA